MTKEEYEKLIIDLTTLFAVDDYEEVMYPIVRDYFLYRIGQQNEIDILPNDSSFWWSDSSLKRAFMILGIDK